MIWLPKFLLHEVSESTLGKNPITGQRRNAYNLGPLGVWYSKYTDPSVLEQEKAEVWWSTISILLSAVSVVLLLIASMWYFIPFGLIPLLIYPLCYYIKYPYSVHVRRFFEIRSHAIEIKNWIKNNKFERPEDDIVINWKITRAANGLSNYKFYDLQLPAAEIKRILLKILS